MKKSEQKNPSETALSDERRREFLRKSVYAAYATPVIMALLVEKASAAQSWDPSKATIPVGTVPPPPPPGY